MNFTVHVNDERVDGDISAVLLSLADAVGELYGDENVVVGSDPHLNDPCDLRLEDEDLVAEVRALRGRVAYLERQGEFYLRRGERFRDERDESRYRVASLERSSHRHKRRSERFLKERDKALGRVATLEGLIREEHQAHHSGCCVEPDDLCHIGQVLDASHDQDDDTEDDDE